MAITAVDTNAGSPQSATALDKEQQAKLLRLQKACREFESIFIYYMLKTMRSANGKSELFGNGLGSEIFQQMFDQGLAEKMGETGQFGISDKMYEKYVELIGGQKTEPKTSPTEFKPVTRNIIPANHHQTAAEIALPPVASPAETAIVTPEPIEPPSAPIKSEEAKLPVSIPEQTKTITKKQKNALSHYDSIIHEAAAAHKVDPQLVKALMLQESGGNPKAVSAKGAKGLMQLMDGTARMLGVSDPFDIKQNIHGGVKYLASLMQKFEGDIKKTLAAYNAGPAAVEKYNGVPPYEETTKFVESILGYFGGLSKSGKTR